LEVQQVISGRKIFVVVLIEAFLEKFGPLTLFHKKLGRIKPGLPILFIKQLNYDRT
jgi:hypothetical protein